MLESEREAKTERVVTHNCTRRSTQDSLSGTPTVYQHKSFIKASCCLPSPTTHTHISPPLQQNPLCSLHFHQNIADEVLSSINHFAALLYCPPLLITKPNILLGQASETFHSGSGCVVTGCTCTINGFAYTLILEWASYTLIYFGNRSLGLLQGIPPFFVDSLHKME